MTTSYKFLSLAALLTLTVAAEAQGPGGTFGGGIILNGGGIYITPTPPILPSVQSRIGSYDKTIGNSWLGGTAHAYAGIVRQKSGTYELGNGTVEFRGTAKLLQQSAEVAEIVGSLTNVMNNGVQSRSGYLRFDVLGYPVINTSFSNSSTFGYVNSQFDLIPGGVSYPIPVGPVSITVAGNAGCGFSRSANLLLPAATAKIGITASGRAYAFADAHVGVGIPGFTLGVGINGHVLEQTLSANCSADAVWGLSGQVSYTLQAISITLYAFADTIFHYWSTNVASWAAGLVSFNLF
ncbi:MAG: hypothetical protein ABIP94_05185 [Planctomycetota bacterium]